MKRTTVLISLLLPLLTTSCASNSQPSTQRAELQALQQERAIARWHQCLEDSLAKAPDNHLDPGKLVDLTLFVCQGHKEDVLATFPRRLEKSLNSAMINQAYETGLDQLENRDGLFSSHAGELSPSPNPENAEPS